MMSLDTALHQLSALLPDGLVDRSEQACSSYAHDRSHHHWQPAAAVVHCTRAEHVSAAVRVCTEHGIPLVARGAGTGLEGAANATAGTVVLDLAGMDQILRVHPRDLDVIVQAGAMKSALNAALAPYRLWFPNGPGVDASIGGMLATRASGTQAVGYGTMRESALALGVVVAGGEMIRTGTRARKSAAGYDLTHLFVGAEGTLGVITEATLRVQPIPERTALLVCTFGELGPATRVVYELLMAGVPLSRAELLDEVQVAAINVFCGASMPEANTVILELAGSAKSIAAWLSDAEQIAVAGGADQIELKRSEQEIDAIWQTRHQALPAAEALLPGAYTWSTDVCVPISKLAECIVRTKRDVDEQGLLAPIVGHVGDGNFHLAFVLRPGDAEAHERAAQVNERLVRRAIELDGTCSGEHGIGRGKRTSLRHQSGPAVDVMRQIKNALDPSGVFNPGAIFGD